MELVDAEVKRFLSKVDRRGPNECWLWTGTKHTTNKKYTPMVYGQFDLTIGGKRFNRNAHRLAWIIANNTLPPPGWVICHKCDTPLCCNPAHLFAGTRADNQRDMQAKLRSGVLGTKNPKAVLSEADVMDIRRSSESDKALAARYGLDVSTIHCARSGRKWKHLPGANPGFYKGTRKLTPEQVRELRALRRAGTDCVTLGRRFGVSQATAWQVAAGNAYRDVSE